MTVTDPLGDMLTRIRNAQLRGKSKVTTPASRMRARVPGVIQELPRVEALEAEHVHAERVVEQRRRRRASFAASHRVLPEGTRRRVPQDL